METRRLEGSTILDFQVFGERRSGTNYFSALLNDAFEITETRAYGWKHGAPVMPCIQDTSLIAVVVRNPIEWLLSMHARPIEAPATEGMTFSDFIRTPWQAVYKPHALRRREIGIRGFPVARGAGLQYDRHPIEGRLFSNVLEMRVVKMQSHLGFLHRAPNVAVVRYEDLLVDPARVIRGIADSFALEVRPEAKLQIRHVGPKTGDKRLTRADISDSDLRYISDELDQDLERRFQYDGELPF